MPEHIPGPVPAAKVQPTGDLAERRLQIAILNDQTSVAESLAHSLDCVHGIDTAGIATDIAQLGDLIRRDTPDAVVAETQLNDMTLTFELLNIAPIANGFCPVVFMAGTDRAAHVPRARAGGAAGYVLKTSPLSTVARAVRVVAAGGTYFDRALRESGTLAPALPSERELQLIGELAVGHTNVEIGHLLAISSRTVESHLRRLFARYAVSSRAQLLMLAVREGWISPTAESPDLPSE